jgi:hypothetical protein
LIHGYVNVDMLVKLPIYVYGGKSKISGKGGGGHGKFGRRGGRGGFHGGWGVGGFNGCGGGGLKGKGHF